MKDGSLDQAIELLLQCVKVDRRYALCYRALGIAYAKAKDSPKAAQYYEQYLRVAPDAADAPKVRQLLENYRSNAE